MTPSTNVAVWLLGALCATACAESTPSTNSEAGNGGTAEAAGVRSAAGSSSGAGRAAAGRGGSEQPPPAGAGPAADSCDRARASVAAFVASHRDCQVDRDCQVVGSCSGGFGFEAVLGSAAEQAQAMSDATPRECASFDGSLFEAICRRDAMPGSRGSCALQETGKSCGEVPSEPKICDGSSAIRLGFNLAGGFVPSSYFFSNPYGMWFAVVDGMCHYWASPATMQGIYTGTLMDAEASQLAEQLQYGKIADWTGDYGGQCTDAPSMTLASPDGAASCMCGCEGAPGGVATAMDSLPKWIAQWVKNGTPLDGGVSALAFEFSGSPNPNKISAWPLDRAIASIPGLLTMDQGGTGKGAAFEPGADTNALRKLRQEAYALDMTSSFILVRESNASTVYTLYVRDDPPTATANAITDFLQTASQR